MEKFDFLDERVFKRFIEKADYEHLDKRKDNKNTIIL